MAETKKTEETNGNESIAAQGLDGVLVNRKNLESLIHYADSMAKILKDAGFPGKATALEERYMKIADEIAMEGRSCEA